MLKRRVPRVLATGFLISVAVSGLSACRTSPTVAAYVGDEQITVDELDAAVEERLADPEVAAAAEGDPDGYTRRVLTMLVQEVVYDEAAQRYEVEVTDEQVRTRVDELLGDDDPDQVFGQLAAQGISRPDVYENVRQQMLRTEIAVQGGQAEGLSEEALRASYEQGKENATTVQLGYIAVPDQATADAVLAQLTADPAGYPAAAARFPGEITLPQLEERAPEQIPAPLVEQATTAKPGTGFTLALPEVGGVIVGFVGPYPPFEELRPDLERQAADAAAEAGNALVEEVRADLDVKPNPRYCVFEEGECVPSDGGVVEILEDAPATDPALGAN